jgi:hypothetical protein
MRCFGGMRPQKQAMASNGGSFYLSLRFLSLTVQQYGRIPTVHHGHDRRAGVPWGTVHLLRLPVDYGALLSFIPR